MLTNRISGVFAELEENSIATETAFVARPAFFVAINMPHWQAELYRLAFEQARAAVEARRMAANRAFLWN